MSFSGTSTLVSVRPAVGDVIPTPLTKVGALVLLLGLGLFMSACDNTSPSAGEDVLGMLATSVSTSGEMLDTDGYTLTVDETHSEDIDPDGAAFFPNLSRGGHEVALTGMAPNCSVDGTNPRAVTVLPDDTSSVAFDVICQSTTGAIEVFASTSGDRPDQNGYTVTVDGSDSTSIASEGQVTFTGLEEDVFDVELSGIKTNCAPLGDNPRSVEVTAPDTATASFDVTCEMALVNALVFESDRSGEPNIHVIDADGTHESQVTTNGGRGPSVSPDGSRIAFHSNRDGDDDIYIINPDGSGLTQVITDAGATDQFASWAPSGNRLTFHSNHPENFDIYTINPDGTDRVRITYHSLADKNPVWSPDGSEIAFQTLREEIWQIYKIHVDTLGTAPVTEDSNVDSWPNWSPASRIAFDTDRDGNSEVYTISADGLNLTPVTNHSATDRFPSWSPDRSRIAFTTDRDGNDEIYTINPDGSGLKRLTNHPDGDRHPEWAPAE